MATVVAKREKVDQHTQSVEVLRSVLGSHQADFRSIASGHGFSEEQINNAIKFVQKLEVEAKK